MNWLVVGALAEDAAGTGEITWLQGAVAKFTETPPEAWIVFGVILLAGILLLAGSRGGKRNARIAGYGLVAIALSFVLSCITLYRMPDGGSVTPARARSFLRLYRTPAGFSALILRAGMILILWRER